MQALAADYLEHFSVDFTDGVAVRLAGSAPEDLVELDRLIGDVFGPGNLVCVYEALCVAADSDLPHCADVDEKVCPLDIYFVVIDFLGARAFPANGGD
uniref:Uncharacterized protein n=1 Tax=Fundidesulfovibrio putealis TaxID=270496 RepID=A0A7C4EHS3_9BACT